MYMYVINHRSIKCSSRTKCLNVVTAVSTLVRRSTHYVTNIKSAAYCYSINYKKFGYRKALVLITHYVSTVYKCISMVTKTRAESTYLIMQLLGKQTKKS